MKTKRNGWFGLAVSEDGSEATINIYDVIGWDVSARSFQQELSAIGGVDTIHLHINSPGGDVIDGNAIYNALVAHPAKVIATIDGWAASMGSIIAMAADEIRMPANTWMMIHNPWSMAAGEKEDLRRMADVLESMESHAVRAYMRHTDKSEDEIRAMMDAETWMDGEQAVEMGFADVLLDEVQIAASVTEDHKLNAPAAALAWVGMEAEQDDGEANENENTEGEDDVSQESNEGETGGEVAAEGDAPASDVGEPAPEAPEDALAGASRRA